MIRLMDNFIFGYPPDSAFLTMEPLALAEMVSGIPAAEIRRACVAFGLAVDDDEEVIDNGEVEAVQG